MQISQPTSCWYSNTHETNPLVEVTLVITSFVSDEIADRCHCVASDRSLHVMTEGKHNLHLRFSAEFNKLVEDFLLQ